MEISSEVGVTIAGRGVKTGFDPVPTPVCRCGELDRVGASPELTWEPTLAEGMLSNKSVRGIGPGPVATRRPSGLGLRLLKLPIGLANPLLVPLARIKSSAGEVDAGATIDTWSAVSPDSSRVARRDAALSRTDGTEYSSCSVPLALGIR